MDNISGLAFEDMYYGPFYLLYALFIIIPSLAMTARRLHDVGKSGWMILISLVPVIGGIWLFVLSVTDSSPGENEYGPNPKETDPVSSASNTTHPPAAANNNRLGDTLILIVCIWLFVVQLFWTIIQRMSSSYFGDWIDVVSKTTNYVWPFIPLGLAFAVNDKSKKTVVIILGGIYMIYGLYRVITM